ncbi:MAG: hypothetical protein O3A00_29045, partial [Planctomycetota bacterium]|nr:hypothetical protein [Planctomycetota bacterium]
GLWLPSVRPDYQKSKITPIDVHNVIRLRAKADMHPGARCARKLACFKLDSLVVRAGAQRIH